jgi:hypothetical protein
MAVTMFDNVMRIAAAAMRDMLSDDIMKLQAACVNFSM